MTQIGDGPVNEQYHERMKAIAKVIDVFFNDGPVKEVGFCIMVFPFEGFDGRCNYMSNAKRKDIVTLFKEQLARFEGQAEMKGKA